MRTLLVIAIAAAALGAPVAARPARAEPPALPGPDPSVELEFFYEPGCAECQRVHADVLPVLTNRYAGLFRLRARDLSVASNYAELVRGMQRLNARENAHVFMMVNGRRLLAGADRIEAELFPAMDEAVADGLARLPAKERAPPEEPGLQDLLRQHAAEFTLGPVIVAGLVDGLNPCAISTLVFLISMLSLSRLPRRSLLLVGIVYCAASFVTYFAIGFGLLHAVHALSVFPLVRRVINYGLIATLAALAIYSWIDAFRFRRTKDAGDVKLQLPDRIKQMIHRIVRTRRQEGWRVAPVFLMGAAVTALESVCTGQVYVPTLVLLVTNGQNVARHLSLLLLYNVMFILPLVIVFVLTYQGLKFSRLMEWSVRNVFTAKLLMGLFFLLLAAALLALM